MLPRPHPLSRTRKALAAGLALLLTPALGVGAHALFSHPLLSRPHVLRGVVDSTHYLVADTADDVNDPDSLRAAVAWANANPGGTITFDATAFATAQTITLTGGELALSQDVTITGPGANLLTVDANNASRVFNVTGGNAAISGLTLTNGFTSGNGGAIENDGTLSLTACAVTDSHADNNAVGGGINTEGALSIAGCLIAGNTAANGNSGGVCLDNSGVVATITDSTLTGNVALAGGGIGDGNGGSLFVTNCTIVGNSAVYGGDGGAILGYGSSSGYGQYTVTASLLVGNGGGDLPNFGTPLTSGGSNLIGNAGNQGPPDGVNHDHVNVSSSDVNLGPLQDNGGPTQTMAALPGSIAIGDDYAGSTTADQRGVARNTPQATVGAYEAAPLASLAVTPASPSVAAGLTQQFTATATYADSTTADVTAQTAWASDNAGVATITSPGGLATGVAQGTANVTASLNGVTSPDDALTVTAPVLTSIAVTPASPSVAKGLTQQFTATATYSDSTTADVTNTATWSSDNTAVATIDPATGLATGKTVGTANVTATSGSVTSTADVLTVTAAVVSSIAVTPASPSVVEGATQQFTATATYSDASTGDVTNTAAWSSDNADVATIDPATGLATAVHHGTAHVTASLGGVTSPSDALTVTHVPVTLVVTNALDDGSVGCLRSVLAASGPGDTVTFDPGVFGTAQTITLNGTELAVSQDVTIQGPGAKLLTVDAGGSSRVLEVFTGRVSVSGLTATNGHTTRGYGGGIVNENGTLTLTDCAVTNSRGDSDGGGVDTESELPLTLVGCTISGNVSNRDGGGIGGFGPLTATNCTIAGNSAQGSGGGLVDYGGATVVSCTFSGNSASSGGGIYAGDRLTLTASLLSGSGGGDVTNGEAAITSGGSNLLGDGDGRGFTNGVNHDQTGVSDAMIGSLADNGGPTPTCAVLAGSPAIGGDYSGGTSVDQRGMARTQAQHTIGAYEYAAPAAVVPVAHVLWNAADGQVQVWAVAADGSHTLTGLYGPYTDDGQGLWHAAALATAPDGTVRLLWDNTDGRVALWSLDAQGGITSLAGYGPYGEPGSGDNWVATGLSVGPDGVTHLLWNHSDGRVTLWYVNPDGSYGLDGVYGPYDEPGSSDVWHATGIATGPNGVTRLLWSHSDGRVTLWYVNPDGSYGLSGVYGPYGEPNSTDNWAATAVSVGPDNVAHILWNHPDGRVTLWYVNADDSYGLNGVYGPYDEPGSSDVWHAASLATGSDGISRILWKHSDGRATLWYVNPDGSYGLTGVFAADADSASQPWEATSVSGD